MDTKNLLVFAGGLIVGYFVAKQMAVKNETTEVTEVTEVAPETTEVNCPPYVNCMPTTEGGTMHPYCTNMPQECVGITAKAV